MLHRTANLLLLAILSFSLAASARSGPPVRAEAAPDSLPPGARSRVGKAQANGKAPVTSIALAPNGKTLAVGDPTTVRLWNLTSGKELYQIASEDVSSLTFSPDGKYLAAVSWAASVHVWEASTGKGLHRLGGRSTGNTTSAVFSPDAKTLMGVGNTIQVLDLATGTVAPSDRRRTGMVWFVTLSPDGKTLAWTGTDKVIHLWDVATGREFQQLEGHQAEVWALAFAPDGRSLASVGGDQTIRLWDLLTGQQRQQFAIRVSKMPEHGVIGLIQHGTWGRPAFTRNGLLLAAGVRDQTAWLWEETAGKEVEQFNGHADVVYSVGFTTDCKTLMTGSRDGTVVIWDIAAKIGQTSASRRDLGAEELENLWVELGDSDASKAYQAIRALTDVPRQAVPFLREKAQRLAALEPKQVATLLANLDSQLFAVRQQASAELEKLGDLAEATLQRALMNKPSVEMCQRLEQLLGRLDRCPGDSARLQGLRATEVLERIGTPEALSVLETLSRRTDRIRLARDAQAAQDRLARRLAAP